MATVQIKIKTIGDTDVTIDKIKNGSPAKLTNGSIKTDSNDYYLATSGSGTFNTGNSDSTFVGQEMFTFTSGGLKFSSNGMLANADGHSAVLVDEENGKEFVWGVVPTSKAYTVQMSIVLTALKLTALTFVGDPIAGQFPTKIVVDGEEYVNDEVDITLPISGTKREIVVQFTEWNRANYSAVLTKVAIMADEITLGNSDIKTLESQSQSTSQPTDIYYGSVPSSGSANIYDKNGDFYDHVRNGVLPNSNVPVELFVNGKRVQGHISTDSHYDVNGRTFSLDFESKLSLYEKVMYEGYAYTDETKTLYEMFETFCEKVGLIDATNKDEKMATMLGEQIVYGTPSKLGTVADYFRAITVPYPYIERGTVRQTLDKFCQLTQLNLIENDNGDLVFVQSRPVRAGNEQVLVIPTHCQMSAIDTDVVIDNDIDKAVVQRKTPNFTENEKTAKTLSEGIANDILLPYDTGMLTNSSTIRVSYGVVSYDDQMYDIGNNEQAGLSLYAGVIYGYYYGDLVTFDKYNYDTITTKMYDNDDSGTNNITYKLTYKKVVGDCYYTDSSSGFDVNDCPLPSWQMHSGSGSQGGFTPRNTAIVYSTPKNESILQDTGEIGYDNLSQDVKLRGLSIAGSTKTIEAKMPYPTSFNNFATAKFSYNSKTEKYDLYVNVVLYKKIVRMIATRNQYSTKIDYKGIYTPVDNNGIKYEPHINNVNLSNDGENTFEGYEEYIPLSLEISCFGDTKTISFQDVDTSADESGEHTVSIGGNEMLQTATTLVVDGTSTDLATQISKNITTDYKNGIETMRLTVCCADYKDTYGVVRKNWSKGEIFEVGDIVRVDKDNNGTPAVTYKNGNAKLWKVTGRTFRNEGVPLVDLELQEII